MTEEQYKKLKNYLNDIFMYLEIKDEFLIYNIFNIHFISKEYLEFIQDYTLEIENKKNNLTFNEVYLLAREIIESINKDYLEKYDKLIETGTLDFNYENEYIDSHYMYDNEKESININRSFNYNDVILLIHEFIHSTNNKERCSINRYLLTEFLSIYYETYAIDYLINNKNISKEEINYFDRIFNTKIKCSRFSLYEVVLLAYQQFGHIDKNTIKLLRENYFDIEESQFSEECLNCLNNFERMEKNYIEDIRTEKQFDNKELASKLSLSISTDYRYILGTILAFYANKNCDMNKITYLNDHINDEDYAYSSIYNILLSIDIDLNDEKFYAKAFENIDEYINRYYIEYQK